MNSKYEIEDLENLSVKELCEKYGSSEKTVKMALYRFGVRKHRAVRILSPYKTPVVVADKQKCAEELRLSRRTVDKALKGERVPILEELNIKLEYVEENQWAK